MAEAKYSLVFEDGSKIDFPDLDAVYDHVLVQGAMGVVSLHKFTPLYPAKKGEKVKTRRELDSIVAQLVDGG